MGISVQGCSRHAGAEKRAVNLHPFEKVREPCKSFACVPYCAIVVDGANVIRCFLLPLDHLEEIIREKSGLGQMNDEFLETCRKDSKIRWFELKYVAKEVCW